MKNRLEIPKGWQVDARPIGAAAAIAVLAALPGALRSPPVSLVVEVPAPKREASLLVAAAPEREVVAEPNAAPRIRPSAPRRSRVQRAPVAVDTGIEIVEETPVASAFPEDEEMRIFEPSRGDPEGPGLRWVEAWPGQEVRYDKTTR
jgi:hypothetical protein